MILSLFFCSILVSASPFDFLPYRALVTCLFPLIVSSFISSFASSSVMRFHSSDSFSISTLYFTSFVFLAVLVLCLLSSSATYLRYSTSSTCFLQSHGHDCMWTSLTGALRLCAYMALLGSDLCSSACAAYIYVHLAGVFERYPVNLVILVQTIVLCVAELERRHSSDCVYSV